MLIEPLKSALYYGPASVTGDGHRMAQAVGISLNSWNSASAIPTALKRLPA